MRYFLAIVFAVIASAIGLASDASQRGSNSAPPQALPLSMVVRKSDHILVGTPVSFSKLKTGFEYRLRIDKILKGNAQITCLRSNKQYLIGERYIYFASSVNERCMDTYGKFEHGFLIRTFNQEEYVVLDREQFIYPDFGDKFFVVQSMPEGSNEPIVIWTGVGKSVFIDRLRNILASNR